ncbi:MAG TPA: hypothetical protein VHO72_01420 [Bacteroidales bacterium]|nr:hypothetical protein [Bacteroidales bacterium]
MKRIAIIAVILFIFSAFSVSYGQDSIKATHRNFLTELNVNLFQGQLSLSNALNQVKFRYFTSDNSALRIGFTVDAKSLVDDAKNVYGTNPTNSSDKRTSTLIGINLGFEHHFRGTKRLSPYIGGEFTFGIKSAKHVKESNGVKTTIKGAWQSTEYYNSGYSYSAYNTERAFVSYGLNMITGFDFYVARNFFIGYEMQFGFTNKSYSDLEVTSTGGSQGSTYPDYDSSEFSFGPRIINGIRVGYVF